MVFSTPVTMMIKARQAAAQISRRRKWTAAQKRAPFRPSELRKIINLTQKAKKLANKNRQIKATNTQTKTSPNNKIVPFLPLICKSLLNDCLC
jgi:hypothetical protein